MMVKVELETYEIDRLVRGLLLDLSIQTQQLTAQCVDAEDISYLQSKLDTIKRLLKAKEGVPS